MINDKHISSRFAIKPESSGRKRLPRAPILHQQVDLDSKRSIFVDGFTVVETGRTRKRAVYHSQSKGNNKSQALARGRGLQVSDNSKQAHDSHLWSKAARKAARNAKRQSVRDAKAGFIPHIVPAEIVRKGHLYYGVSERELNRL